MQFTKFKLNHGWKSTFRVISINKLNLTNSFSLPEFKKISVFLVLNKLENFDNSRLVAASFILKLLTKQQPYVVKFNLFQTFKKKDYDINICVSLRNNNMYNFISVLSNLVIPALSKVDSRVKYSLCNSCIVANFAILDFSFIKIVETHSIFFRWRDRINISLHTNSKKIIDADYLLNTLKLTR